MALRDPPLRRQHQPDRELGHRHRIAAGRARHLDAERARRIEREIVDAHAPFVQQLQLAPSPQHLLAHRDVARDGEIGIGNDLLLMGEIARGGGADLEPRGQQGRDARHPIRRERIEKDDERHAQPVASAIAASGGSTSGGIGLT